MIIFKSKQKSVTPFDLIDKYPSITRNGIHFEFFLRSSAFMLMDIVPSPDKSKSLFNFIFDQTSGEKDWNSFVISSLRNFNYAFTSDIHFGQHKNIAWNPQYGPIFNYLTKHGSPTKIKPLDIKPNQMSQGQLRILVHHILTFEQIKLLGGFDVIYTQYQTSNA